MIKSNKYRLYDKACASTQVVNAIIDVVEPPPVSASGSVTLHPTERSADLYGSVRTDNDLKWQGGLSIGGDGRVSYVGDDPDDGDEDD